MNIAMQQLKALHPIKEVAGRYVRLRRSGKYLVGCCPFHRDKTPSFTVNPATGRWRCFGRCATGWLDVIDFLGWQKHGAAWNARNPEMFKAVLRELNAGTLPIAQALPPRPLRPTPKPVELSLDAITLLTRAASIYRARLWTMSNELGGPETPLSYLRSRGFTDEIIRDAGIGYCAGDQVLKYLRHAGIPPELPRQLGLIDEEHGDREFFRGRIVFPEMDERGQVIHLAGRKWSKRLGAKSPKYLALKGLDKPLYGWATLDRKPSEEPVFIVESLPDGLTLKQWGFEVLITLGTALTETHARSLARLPRPLIYIPQNDEAGLVAVQKWQEVIGQGEVLELPIQTKARLIKDVNDLAAITNGRELFGDLLQLRNDEESSRSKAA
jgi:DNA primase